MPRFIGQPEEITVELALNTLQLFIVGDATQKEAYEALKYLKEFIETVRKEYEI